MKPVMQKFFHTALKTAMPAVMAVLSQSIGENAKASTYSGHPKTLQYQAASHTQTLKSLASSQTAIPMSSRAGAGLHPKVRQYQNMQEGLPETTYKNRAMPDPCPHPKVCRK